jgi:hypothetical protein
LRANRIWNDSGKKLGLRKKGRGVSFLHDIMRKDNSGFDPVGSDHEAGDELILHTAEAVGFLSG